MRSSLIMCMKGSTFDHAGVFESSGSSCVRVQNSGSALGSFKPCQLILESLGHTTYLYIDIPVRDGERSAKNNAGDTVQAIA